LWRLLATGVRPRLPLKLAQSLGAEIVGLAFCGGVGFSEGREKLKGHDVFSLLNYDK